MGIQTCFFSAPALEVASQNLSEGVPAAYPSAAYNLIDDLKVAVLESILTGKDASEALKTLMSRCVYSHDASGISVVQLSDDLVKALATQTDGNALETATRWLAGTTWERFGRRAGDVQDLADTIVAIGKLASNAQAPAQGLFLWECP